MNFRADIDPVLLMACCSTCNRPVDYPDTQLQSTEDILVGMGLRLRLHHCERML